MDGHVKIERFHWNPICRCWVADAEADNGFGYQGMLVSGRSPGDIVADLKQHYRVVTEPKIKPIGITK